MDTNTTKAMDTRKRAKKTALADWHRADVVAALRKAGWTVRKLAAHHGYASHGALTSALGRPYPKAQRLIAEAIGVAPEAIWPSRYERRANTASNASADGSPDTHVLTRQSSEVQTRDMYQNNASKPPVREVATSLEQVAA